MSNDAKIFESYLNPVLLVFMGKLSLSTQMSTHMPGFQSFSDYLHHFLFANLATSSIRVKINFIHCFTYPSGRVFVKIFLYNLRHLFFIN